MFKLKIRKARNYI